MAWSQEQLHNAAIIYQVGRSMGLGTRDIQIGLITAMVESNLRNVNYGDRDSLGLFQQRPSQGWGTPEQVLNPQYAAKKFFSTLVGLGNRRYEMSMGSAAQAVQRSAYPGRYDERVSEMRAMWPRIGKAGGDEVLDVDGKPYQMNVLPSMFARPQMEQQEPLSLDEPDGQVSLEAPDMGDLPGMEAMDAAGMPNFQELQEQHIEKQFKDLERLNFQLGPGTQQILQQQVEISGNYQPGVDGWRGGVVELGKSLLGVPYVWGGTSPSGFDCSGLVQYVYGKMGIRLPRVSYQQARAGKAVGLGELVAGDLVAWDNSSRNNGADHIAIYIGNGMILEAPRPGTSVRIRKLGRGEGAWGVKIRG